MDDRQQAAALEAMMRDGRLAELEKLSREALARHRFFLWHMYLIVALLRTNRREEAARELDDLFSYKFNIAERAFPEIKEAFPEKFSQHFILDTMKPGLGIEGEAHVHVRKKWDVPYPIASESAFGRYVDHLIAETVPKLPKLSRSVPVATFGSCFAANLAQCLKGMGVDASNLLIEESINSPLANRAFLEGLAQPADAEHTSRLESTYGKPFLEQARGHLARAHAIILTLGVAPSFFHRESGKLAFLEDYRALLSQGVVEMRTPTVEQTKAVIRDVLGLVRRLNPTARLYVTISPVPLMGTVELPSALIADCVSKTTLRAALHETLQPGDIDSVHYWPSFEIVRWLGAHTAMPVFAADDNVSRHVSNWLVKMIVERFHRHLFA